MCIILCSDMLYLQQRDSLREYTAVHPCVLSGVLSGVLPTSDLVFACNDKHILIYSYRQLAALQNQFGGYMFAYLQEEQMHPSSTTAPAGAVVLQQERLASLYAGKVEGCSCTSGQKGNPATPSV